MIAPILALILLACGGSETPCERDAELVYWYEIRDGGSQESATKLADTFLQACERIEKGA